MKRDGRGNFLPTFQTSPPPIKSNEIYENVDLFSDPNYKSVALAAVKLKDAVFSQFSSSYITDVDRIVGESQHHKLHNDYHPIVETDRFTHPHSIAAQPIYNKLETSSSKIVGYLFSIIAWDFFLVNLLPQGVDGVFVVFRNSCNQSVSYQLDGNEVRAAFNFFVVYECCNRILTVDSSLIGCFCRGGRFTRQRIQLSKTDN